LHLENIEIPHEAWEKLESLFGKNDIMRAMHIDAQLTALYPYDFSTIVDFLTKFKNLYTQLKGSGKKKEEKECIFFIMSKLKDPFHIFASTFISIINAMGDKFVMPSLEEFCDCIMRGKKNIHS